MTGADKALWRGRAAPGMDVRFLPRPMSHVECTQCNQESPADPAMVVELRREADPDVVTVATLECPVCHAVGLLHVRSGEAMPGEDWGVLAALLDEEGRASVAHGG